MERRQKNRKKVGKNRTGSRMRERERERRAEKKHVGSERCRNCKGGNIEKD